MKTQTTAAAPARRAFLVTAGLGSAAAVATVASLKPTAAPVAVAKAPAAGTGYHTSAHIQDYYASARV